MDADSVFKFERERWEAEGWQRELGNAVNRLKGQAAGLTARRLDTFQYLNAIVDQIEQARDVLLADDPYLHIGGKRLAAQLSAQGVVTQRDVDPKKLSDGGKKWADGLMSADAQMIDEAVMECRTRMTAMCLSADFEGSTAHGLEAEYFEIIADIVALGRRVRNDRTLPRQELLRRARDEAISVAKEQRQVVDRGLESMFERERYWRDRIPPIKNAFEK